MSATVLCESCGHDFRDDEAHDALATLFTSDGLDVRADLHLSCPECGHAVEAEVRFITPISQRAETEADM